LNMQDYLTDEQIVKEEKIQERNEEFLEQNPRWKDHLDQKQKKEYRDNLNEVIEKINNFSIKSPESWQKKAAEKAINYAITQAAAMIPFGSIIMGIANLLGMNVARKLGLVKTDISGNVINKNYVTEAELGFYQGEEYEDFWPGKDPEDTKGAGPAKPPQLGGPSTEEMATEYDFMGWMRANQARKKAREEKIERERLAREENPIVGTTEMDIIALGNSGGLANLFRVKNQ
ncbi:uncharacterized protein METZ01_LOCUS158927, partial [marine metagenome]